MVSLRNKEQEEALSKAIIDGSLKPHIDANNIINDVPLSIDTEEIIIYQQCLGS